MAEINLRAYVKDVDSLVELEQLDEAIAHCRHILETYPKHVDTYRVLGKAYLEAKRFGDAADIFQRVLSAVPDDFVAHIGMAIVREDEGNLDAAIWHIERAFETNPANPAIQQELRRLIGRRDGLEPHKVRMTRGALARMYAHGELYPQAIAELTSALKDDSDRPDLEALLATMYWRSDKDVEAADVCNRILDKLPHCREANRILAAILQAGNKLEDAKLYHRRLAALDPYAAYVETANIDPQTVDANMVLLTRLEWEPGKPMPAVEPGQPEWAASLGVDLGEEEPEEAIVPEEEEKPSWLKDLETPIEPVKPDELAEPVEPSREPEPSPEPMAESEIPDWMREAGWQESTGEAVDAPISFTDDELTALERGEPLAEGETGEEGELAPADIPGWLQDIAPTEPELTTPEPVGVVDAEVEMGEDEDLPDWLSEIDEDITEIQPEGEELPTVEPEAPIEEMVAEVDEDIVVEEPLLAEAEMGEEKETARLPTWLESETPGATTTIVTWLGDREAPEESLPAEEIPEEVTEALPSESAREIPEEMEEELPSWLAEAEIEGEEVTADAVEPVDIEAAPPWLAEIGETAEQVEEEPVEGVLPEPVAADEAPSWLSEIAEIPAEEEPEAVTPEVIEAAEEEAPSWLAGVAEVAAEEAPEPEAVEPVEEEEAPSWLAGVAEVAAEQEPPSLPEEAPSELEPTPALSEDDVPEWLRSISEPGIEPSVKPPIEEEPAWLEGIAEPEAEIPSEGLPIPTPEAPEWLKGIAEPETEMEAPEDITPAEKAPDWLTGIAEPEIAGEPTVEAPEWLQEFTDAAAEEPEPIAEEPTPEVSEEIEVRVDIPEVVEPIVEPEEEVVLPSETEHPAEVVSGEELDDDEVLGWLEGLAARQGVEEEELITTPEERVSELPSEIEMPPEDVVVEGIDIPEEPEKSLEWLERLASERGLDIDITPPAPVEIGEVEAEAIEPDAPDWLDQLATQPIPKITPELEAEIPDWLTEEEVGKPTEPPVEPIAPEPTPELKDEVEPVAPLEPPGIEPEPELPTEVPPTVEEITIEPVSETPPLEPLVPEPEPEVEPEPLPATERPVDIATEVAPEIEPTLEPEPSEPIAEIEPEAPVEPVPIEPMVEAGAAIPLTPELTEEPPPVEIVPIEPIEIAEPGEPAPVEPTPVEPTLTEPRPVEPPPVEPPPAEPTVVEPRPVEPSLVEPPPVEPSTVAPTLIEPADEAEAEPAPTPEPAPTFEEPVPIPPKEKVTDPAQILDNARQALASDDINQAVTGYRALIKKKVELDRVIEDLRTALERDPKEPDLWQVLGDAYMENDQLTEAINAYQRGMEVA